MANDFLERIKGPVFPVITPFKKTGEIDWDELHRYLEFLYKNGASIFYVMAHSSRLGLLETGEVIRLNREVCEHFNGYGPMATVICATPMYGGIGSYTEVATEAMESGADLLSVLFTERYYSYEQVIEFYEEMAECGPILVHAEWLNSKVGSKREMWSIALLNEVLSLDNVVALKEDSGVYDFTERVIQNFSSETAIIVSGNGKSQFLSHSDTGCQAYLVGVGSFFPALAIRFYEDYCNKKYDRCNKIIGEIEQPFFEIAMELGWHIALKSAMEHLGIMGRYERSPLKALELSDHIKVGNKLEEIKSTYENFLFYDLI